MSLNIKNADAERLVRELASITGESVTRAVAVAVGERLERLAGGSAEASRQVAARLREIAADARGRWAEPFASADHGSLLYDDRGLPR